MRQLFDRKWFEDHQKILLWFTNNRIGRKFFGIDGNKSSVGKNRITRIDPNAIFWTVGGKDYAEFRTKSKYSNRLFCGLRFLWNIFHIWDNVSRGTFPSLNLGFDTLTVYPDANPETSTTDGWVMIEGGEVYLSWAQMVSGNGTAAWDSTSDMFVGMMSDPDDSMWQRLIRSIVMFDTSSIGAGSTVSSATLSVYGKAKTDDLSVTPNINVYSSTTVGDTSLDPSDYENCGSTAFSTAIAYGSFSTSGYNDFALNATGLAAISKTGISKFSLRNANYDVANVTPAWTSDSSSTLSMHTADAAGTSTDPKLVVQFGSAPTVTTTAAGSITTSSATLGGDITSTGGENCTTRGVCYSESPSPTILDTVLSEAGSFGTGTFSFSATGLSSHTKYYVRAFAINSYGTSYGSEVSFFTLSVTLAVESGSVFSKKRYFAKFYTDSGNYLGTADDISFNSFTKTINGGLGELSLTLARPFDDFGEGVDIDFMNEVQIWIVDKESGKDGIKVYSGFIDTYEPYAGNGGEGVNVRCLGYVTRLEDVMYKNGTAISITQNSKDPAFMIKDVIEKYRSADYMAKVSHTASSVNNTGNTASYTFVMKSCMDAIEKARELSPADWWWYVDEDNVLWFDHKHPRATHTFTFGKDVANISVNKNIRDVKNRIVIWNGLDSGDPDFLCRSYKNNASVGDYHLRMEQKTDSRVTVSGTMDLWGNAFIDARKDPNVKVTVDVVDSNGNDLGYDIESINPGDTCQILNLPGTSSTLDDNMVITRVNYGLDRVTLELEELRQKLSQKFVDVTKELKQYVYNDGPTSYTDV